MESTNLENTEGTLLPNVSEVVMSYQSKIESIIVFCSEIKDEAEALINDFDEKVEELEKSVSGSFLKAEELSTQEKRIVGEKTKELHSAVQHYESILESQGLNSEERKGTLANLKEVIDFSHQVRTTEVDQLLAENKQQLIEMPQMAKSSLLENLDKEKTRIQEQFATRTKDLGIEEERIFNQYHETITDFTLIDKLTTNDRQPQSFLNLGKFVYIIDLFGVSHDLALYHFIPFFHQKNILIKNNEITASKAIEVVNGLIARSLLSFKPGQLKLHLIDPKGRGMNFKKYSKLSDSLKTVYTEEKGIEKLFKQLDKTITTNFQSFLKDEFNHMGEYNETNESQPYHLVVLLDDAGSFSKKSTTKRLKAIIENGPMAGINSILVTAKEDSSTKKTSKEKSLKELVPYCNIINLKGGITEYGLNNIPIEYYEEDQINISNVVDQINNII